MARYAFCGLCSYLLLKLGQALATRFGQGVGTGWAPLMFKSVAEIVPERDTGCCMSLTRRQDSVSAANSRPINPLRVPTKSTAFGDLGIRMVVFGTVGVEAVKSAASSTHQQFFLLACNRVQQPVEWSDKAAVRRPEYPVEAGPSAGPTACVRVGISAIRLRAS